MEELLITLFYLVALAFYLYVGWRIFEKAGKEGWKALVPIYNLVVLLRIVGRPVWWIALCLIPLINIIVIAVVYIDLAKSFGKGTGFGLGLAFLGFIFAPLLAFGDAEYKEAHAA